MLKKILEIIFPTCCGICNKQYTAWICPKCYHKIKNECKYIQIKKDNFYLYCIGKYSGELRKLILKFKFKEASYLANTFVEIISKNKEFVEQIKKYDYIIPVPMYKENQNIRGYNQTELLAKKIKEKLQIEYHNILIKTKQNKKQSTLKEKERIENVQNIYKLQNQYLLKDKKVLLLDDIYTTGSTVKSCIQELKKSEVKEIAVLVIAKRKI